MLRQRTMRFWATVIAASLAAACGTAGDAGQATSTIADPSTTTSEEANTTSTPEETEMDVEEQVTADLAGRLGVAETDIEVLRVEAVTWPDGSLGCPEPGKMYTQALVEGQRVVLGYQERVYIYHSGQGDEPFLCPSEEKDGGHDFIPPPGDAEK